MKDVLMFVGIFLLIATLWTAILGFPNVSGLLGICWSMDMLVYVVAGAFD